MISPELMQILASPLDPARGPLRQFGDRLICDATGHAFPIVDGVPLLRPEDAIPLDPNQDHE